MKLLSLARNLRGLQANHCRAIGLQEVQRDVPTVGTEVAVATDELRTLIGPDVLREAKLATDPSPDRSQHLKHPPSCL